MTQMTAVISEWDHNDYVSQHYGHAVWIPYLSAYESVRSRKKIDKNCGRWNQHVHDNKHACSNDIAIIINQLEL